MKPNKRCPKCNLNNWPGVKTCKDCGHKFPFKKKPNKAPPVDLDRPQATFSAGLSIEGGLVVNFHAEGTFVEFTPEQAELIFRVLNVPRPAPAASE